MFIKTEIIGGFLIKPNKLIIITNTWLIQHYALRSNFDQSNFFTLNGETSKLQFDKAPSKIPYGGLIN